MRHKTVCIDFDGVIHDFDGRWKGHSSIEGGPVVDQLTGRTSIDWLNAIADDYDIIIHTTRGQTVLGQEAVKRWLERHGADRASELLVTDEKPPALIYIDDRAWRFEGVFPTNHEIDTAYPWNRKPQPGPSTLRDHGVDTSFREIRRGA